jgi:uncharacterized membrane protein
MAEASPESIHSQLAQVITDIREVKSEQAVLRATLDRVFVHVRYVEEKLDDAGERDVEGEHEH